MAYNLPTRQFFSVTLIFFFVNPCFAKWELISSGYLGNVYIDVKTIKKRNNYIVAWQLQDLNSPDKFGIRSRRILFEFDCDNNKRRIIYLSAHSEQMAKGEVLQTSGKISSWNNPLPKSLGERILKRICTNL